MLTDSTGASVSEFSAEVILESVLMSSTAVMLYVARVRSAEETGSKEVGYPTSIINAKDDNKEHVLATIFLGLYNDPVHDLLPFPPKYPCLTTDPI